MDFTDDQINRYARHILLPEVGGEGQAKLLGARVLVVGAGGLGSPLLLYLAAAGVGTLGIVDDDVVDLTNLQRQIVHVTDSIGRPKVESAADMLGAINPDVNVVTHKARLDAGNALDLIGDYDVVCDGSDNFETKFLLNDACYFARVPLVAGAILRFAGQVYIFREPPPPGTVPTCAEAGVMGALCGMIGSTQATEVIKEILGIGESLAGSLLVVDALSTTFRKIRARRDADCPLCGDNPTIKDLGSHEPG
jgi:molybdopterin-synthase adenylyltransferase